MLPEIGHFCLIMALCMAIIQAFVPLWDSFNLNPRWLNLGFSTALGQLCFLALSFMILIFTLLTNDFSVSYVAQNSNSHLPIFYRICASWGAHEGSLLLWVFILSLWTVGVAAFSRSMPLTMKARVLSVLGLISVGFLLFILLTSNPFVRLLSTVPLEGRDLNPLLQDPGLAIHPPMLYMGYVGFSVAFAFGIAALMSGKFDAQWARLSRAWTLIAWGFLTLGITLGSWWAYRVLGWGGWWFWDPVENASFLPWLSGTALIHSLLVSEKRDVLKAWTILLAVCTFSLSLMGTFLVRSGILVSVHAFAIDASRGVFMLNFLAVVVGGSLGLYAFRGHSIQSSGIFKWWSRETLLLSNNVLLTTAMLTVLLGTLYPLMIDALGLGKLSVGSPYFNAVFLPLMVPLLFIMGIGPALQWREGQFKLIIKRFKYSLLLCFSAAMLLPWILAGKIEATVILGLFLAFWVIAATLQTTVIRGSSPSRVSKLGMQLSHIGFALCVIGVVASSAFSIQKDIRMQFNDHLVMGPYKIQFNQVFPIEGPNYSAFRGLFSVTYRQKTSFLQPEVRFYPVQKMAMAKTAIRARPFHDLYIALGEQLAPRTWSLRIYYKPFVRWIWLGGILMMLGGFVAASRIRQFPHRETSK